MKKRRTGMIRAMAISLAVAALPVNAAAKEKSDYTRTYPAEIVQDENTEGTNQTEGTTEDGYQYIITDKAVSITGYSGNASALEIPSSILGYPVKSIKTDAFYDCDTLTSVIIPEGVTSIGSDAFALCSNLQKVFIPGSVWTIGQGAFCYCTNLTDVTISNGVHIIEGQAFGSCTSLVKIFIPDSVTTLGTTGDLSGPFDRCFGLKEISLPCSLKNDIDWLYSRYPSNRGTATVTVRDHSFGTWTTTSKATVYQAKQQERTCGICGEKQTQTVGKKLKGTIHLTARSLKMKTGQTTTAFKAYGFADGDSLKAVVSSDPSIVEVSDVKENGTLKLTAKNTGKAILTFTTESGVTKKAKIVVRRSTIKTVSVTGIPKTLTLKKGTTQKLKPVLKPVTSQEKVTYKSSDKSVAYINRSGKITARKKGTATITVTSGTKTATCKITVY